MARIYTKTGDTGETGLIEGARVSKADERIAAIGDVDETNCWLGLALSKMPVGGFEDLRALLSQIQSDLFVVGAALASEPEDSKLEPDQHRPLERAIDEAESELEPLRNFILPGGSNLSARLHLARAVCRRAERSVVRLAEGTEIDQKIVIYLNRLSDLLFVLGRTANKRLGVSDVKWFSEGNK